MKAAVLYKTGQPLVIEENILIPALRAGQVLTRIHYSGICHSQLMEVRGKRGEDRFLPHLLGHEATAEVLDIGEGVSKVKPGDKVVLGWIKGQGMEAGGVQYAGSAGQIFNAGAVATFADYAVVSENRCVPLPEGIPMDLGVLFGCALPTGGGMVLNTIKPEPGSTVVIVGLGGVGLGALMMLRLLDCAQIIVVDVEDSKLQLALQLGATTVLNPMRDDVEEEVKHLTRGGADISIESAGTARTIELAFKLVRQRGGRCIFASHPPQGETICLDPFELIAGKEIVGSWGGGSMPDRDIPRYAEYYREKRLPLEFFSGGSYTLDDINQAMDDIEERKVVRAIINLIV